MSDAAYRLVGCRECGWEWIIEADAQREWAECGRCGTRRRREKLRTHEAHDNLHALRAERGRWLAADADMLDEYERWGTYNEQCDGAEDRLASVDERAFERASEWGTEEVDLPPLQSSMDQVLEDLVEDREDGAGGYRRATPTERVREALVDEQISDHGAPAGLADSIVDDLEGASPVDVDRAGDPGVSAQAPTGNSTLPDVLLDDIEPRSSTWLEGLNERLLPYIAQAVRDRVRELDPSALADKRPTREIVETLVASGVEARGGLYASVLLEYAVRYCDDEGSPTLPFDPADVPDDRVDHHVEHRERLETWLARAGTGKGSWVGDALDHLQDGPVAALALDERVRTVQVRFDAPAWDVDDRRAGERALEVLTSLGAAADVELVITSTGLARSLAQFDALDDVDLSGMLAADHRRQDETDQSVDLATQAWEVLGEHYWSEDRDQHGDLRLLANLPEDGYRWQSTLTDDPDIDLGESAVSRALSERLEPRGLVARSRDASGRKRVQLTSLGRAALDHLAADGSLVPPDQATLDVRFTAPSHARAGSVYRAQQGREGGERSRRRSAEAHLAATGDAEAEGYVQWLDGPDGPTGRLDAFAMHKRYAAAARGAVACVDDPEIQPFDDGRVSYLSAFDDEVLVICQWGRSLPTLARIATTLLSDRALSKLLSPERLGREFERLETGDGERILHAFDDALHDILRDGMQLGWFSEDEHEWEGWRDRITGVRSLCLEKLGDVAGEWTDLDERSELYKDLHGLLGIATQLYRAADLDLVVNIRVPNSLNIERDDFRLDDFKSFVERTIPKQAVIDSATGPQSHWRHTHETRESKIPWKRPLGEDPDALASEPTMQWVVSGRTATDLQTHIEQALDPEVRERVQEGVEEAPHLDVEVANGCSFPAIRQVVEEFAAMKGKQVGHETYGDHTDYRTDVDRLTRLFMSILGDSDRPQQCNPSVVAEAMLTLASSTRTTDTLTIDDVEAAIARLPPHRVDGQSLSAGKIVQVLFASDDPMTRQEVLDEAEISKATWYRERQALEALGIVQQTEGRDGDPAYIATVEPWWSETARHSSPDGDEHDPVVDGGIERDIIYELACALDVDVDHEAWAWPPDLEAIYRDPDLRRWRAFIWMATAQGDEVKRGPPDVPSVHPPQPVRLGYRPEQRDPEQPTLATSAASDTGASPRLTDGGRERGE